LRRCRERRSDCQTPDQGRGQSCDRVPKGHQGQRRMTADVLPANAAGGNFDVAFERNG
jgi:hypothetical protein